MKIQKMSKAQIEEFTGGRVSVKAGESLQNRLEKILKDCAKAGVELERHGGHVCLVHRSRAGACVLFSAKVDGEA